MILPTEKKCPFCGIPIGNEIIQEHFELCADKNGQKNFTIEELLKHGIFANGET